ncbi:signal peptide peptidase SppA [Gemmatimonas groenlandica]|uniref:Signal peptide peptidase SppA n=2 Tax=Gemmatimonas groenlandica TaxID=2732249 RepID=A0A6M4IV59_9BACT|nr:signal peptide peptidase SppA [Gemmatimonas groenlandica]
MKQFLTAIAANLLTIAICVVGGILLIVGIAASAGSKAPVEVADGSVLVIDLDRAFSDRPAETKPGSFLDDALSAGRGGAIPLRAATIALKAAADDDRISGILLRGSISADGYASGFAALRELRAAIATFRQSKKPVHAYLVNPDTRDYYVASAASVVTLDPFGSLLMPGLASEQVFFTGMFEKYGIGMQVSRVGRFKAAVEPFTRQEMSPENRLQTESYLGDLWSEVKRGVAQSRGIDTVALQTIVDTQGIILAADAKAAKLVDRIAYFDDVLDDLQKLASAARSADGAKPSAKDSTRAAEMARLLDRPTLPQITLGEYAPIAVAKDRSFSASQTIAIVYAEGDIVDGEGGDGTIGGASMARELRRVRNDAKVKAVVLRVNSPGGSAIASEQIQRELTLIAKKKPIVVSMGTVAASGGYWISTAAVRVFAQPNTITGSIGVFSLVPNIKTLANRNGVTFDTVKTGRYADLFSIARPRSEAELAVLQRGTDAVYEAFITRVSTARKLTPDSVRAIAEGRVWSGDDAMRIGLVDSMGGLDAALKSAATLAKITGDYDVREYPRVKSATEKLTDMLDNKPTPVAAAIRAASPAGANALLSGRGPASSLARDITHELDVLLRYNDPRGVYARMPFVLRIH